MSCWIYWSLWWPMLWHVHCHQRKGTALRRRRAKAPGIFYGVSFYSPIYLILYASFHLYVPKRIQGRRSELANICKANVIGLCSLRSLLFGLRRFVSHLSYFSTKMILAFFAANIILLEAERISIRIFLRSLRTNGYNQKHVLLIGYSRAAEGFIDRVSVNPEWGYHVQGILDDHRPAGLHIKRYRCWDPPIIWRISWRPIRWTK